LSFDGLTVGIWLKGDEFGIVLQYDYMQMRWERAQCNLSRGG